ncbi:MAG: ABC transporter substrate-binding protein [Acidilobaceae archaeon]|nr:ABC transporter substrate-binding protein [Acidilobaceae archaeon]
MVKLYAEALDKEVEVPDNPQRIVSLAPAITEILFMLGLEERVAGVSIYCNKPPQAKEKPKVGSYWKVLYSKLEPLKPDLILVTTGAQLVALRELVQKGYTVFPVSLPVTLPGLFEYVIKVGAVVGELERARELARRLEEEARAFRGALAGLKVHYEIDLGGPVSPGGVSYIADSFHYMGARSTFDQQRESWVISPSSEAIIQFDPDVFGYEFQLGVPLEEGWLRPRLEARGLGGLRAVREGLILMEYDSLAHYGPSFFKALRAFVERVKRRRGEPLPW